MMRPMRLRCISQSGGGGLPPRPACWPRCLHVRSRKGRHQTRAALLPGYITATELAGYVAMHRVSHHRVVEDAAPAPPRALNPNPYALTLNPRPSGGRSSASAPGGPGLSGCAGVCWRRRSHPHRRRATGVWAALRSSGRGVAEVGVVVAAAAVWLLMQWWQARCAAV